MSLLERERKLREQQQLEREMSLLERERKLREQQQLERERLELHKRAEKSRAVEKLKSSEAPSGINYNITDGDARLQGQDVYIGEKAPAELKKAVDIGAVSGTNTAGTKGKKGTTSKGGGKAAATLQAADALVKAYSASQGGGGETDTGAAVGQGALGGAATGASIGAMGGVPGAAVGAAVGAVVGGGVGAIQAKANRKRAAIAMHNKKLKELAEIEGQRARNINDAIANMASRIGSSLNVPIIRL